jgi:pyridinium-3,5-biscarboxylic acid mononucleotide sulfurtransferase
MAHSGLIQIGDAFAAVGDERSWRERLDALRETLRASGPVVVAYSGGVDSSVLLRVAHEVLGARALGVIGRSDSYATRELELALEQAAAFGAHVEIVTTGELSDPRFRANPTTRCYHCKTQLYSELQGVAVRLGATIMDGTIADDIADWRPGRRAADERGVQSPLAELGFTKADIRAAAAHYGLASRDKPASPCLASRIPYGTEITREVLQMVEQAEALLREMGFVELRVRHYDDTARIEVPVAEIGRFADPAVCSAVVRSFKSLGYRRVTLDLEGFRSGSLNEGQVPTSGRSAGPDPPSADPFGRAGSTHPENRNPHAGRRGMTDTPHGGGGTA